MTPTQHDIVDREAEAYAAEIARPALEALARLERALSHVVTSGAEVVENIERLVKSRAITRKLFVSEVRRCPQCGHAHDAFIITEEP